VVAPQLVPFVFGANYHDASRLVALGVMTTLVVATKQAALVGLMSERRTSFSLIDSLVVSALYAVLSHLLTGALGITGLMLAELGSQLVSLTVVGFVIAPRFKQAGVASEAYKAAFCLLGGLVALLCLFFSFDSQLRWLIGFAVSVGAAAMVWVLLTTEQERSALLPLLRSLQQRKR
jgi:O-antigen/teichoic acid export membrane protein